MGIGDKFKNIFSKSDSKKAISFKELGESLENRTEISLDADVICKRNEERIRVNNDELIIEGNGHTIDAKEKTGMFYVNYDTKLTIKNVIFKNASESAITQYSLDSLITLIDCTFENCISECGGAMFINNGRLKAKNCIFKDNKATRKYKGMYDIGYGGGAIFATAGEMVLHNCLFENNFAVSEGGAISIEYSNMVLDGCTFKDNSAKEGGIIHNNLESETELRNCRIISNKVQTEYGIYNKKGNLKLFDCEILDNENIPHLFRNDDFLEFHYCTFGNNTSSEMIENSKGSTLSIMNGKFINNSSERNLINNFGKSCTIEKTLFENNEVTNESLRIIHNGSNMTLIRPKFNDVGIMITNNREIIIKSSPDDLKEKIEGSGGVTIDDGSITFSQNDFHNLDKKIHENDGKEIVLDADVGFERYEIDYYEGGIELDIDGLTIDGNGKTIDGKGLSRIFLITGKNITLKNITFKNGLSHRNPNNPINGNGGVLRIHSEGQVKIENCNFTDNESEEIAGAIYNNGELRLIESELRNNTALNCAAIYSTGKLEIIGCDIINNNANIIGAVFNFNGEMNIENSTFKKNKGKSDVGALASIGNLKVSRSEFSYNSSGYLNGGAVRSSDAGYFERCSFRYNRAASGGAIYNSGEMQLVECELIGNFARDNGVMMDERSICAGAINNEGEFKASRCIFDNNSSRGGGGAIYTRKRMELEECTFTNNNTEENIGGAIFSSGVLNLTNCILNDNKSKEGGAIYYATSAYEEKNELNMIKSTFSENRAEKGGAIFLSPHKSGMPINIEECDFSNNDPDDIFEK